MKVERIIFTSGVNTFYEMDDAYKLVNQKENFVILDKNEKMLLKITELLQKKLALYFNSGNGVFYFSTYENGEVRYYCSLRQFVVAFNMGGNFEEKLNVVKSNTVLLVNDKETWNLKRENLEFTGIDNNINVFYTDGEYFYIKHRKMGYTIRTDLDEKFNELLKQYRWVYSEGCKTLGTYLEEGKSNFIAIHRFVREYFDCCNENMNMNSWSRAMKKLSKKTEINVDHLDSDKMNCCQNNLVWMKARDNIRKGNLTKKLNQVPFRCKLVSSKYGIQMEAGYIDESYKLKIISNYENPSDFVDALRNFWKTGILQDDAGKEYKLPQVPEIYFKETIGCVNEQKT